MRCVSYTRTVPWKNTKLQLSITEQNEKIAAYLEQHKELELQKKYTDRKNDAQAFAGFDNMIDDGTERKYDCIIVASIYYCGQSFPVANQMIWETLIPLGIHLIVVDEEMDTRQAAKKEVENYFDAKYCEMHAEIIFAWRKKQGAGFRLTNSVPYGYIRRNGENHLEKDEVVAPYLSEAFARYIRGQRLNEIAVWLNEKQVPTAKVRKAQILGKAIPENNTEWTTDRLRALFRNPSYTGAMANTERQIIVENCHEPYLTKEQFGRLPCNQRIGKERIPTRKEYKKPNPLAGLISCSCGIGIHWHKDNKTGEEIFFCPHCNAGKKKEERMKIPSEQMYQLVLAEMDRLNIESEQMILAIQNGAGREAIEAVHEEKSAQTKTILAEMNMEQFHRVALYDGLIDGEMTRQEYDEEVSKFAAVHCKLNERLTALMEETRELEKGLSLRNPWLQLFADYKETKALDRSFVRKYIQNVIITFSSINEFEVSVTPRLYEWKQMLDRLAAYREEDIENGTEKQKTGSTN